MQKIGPFTLLILFFVILFALPKTVTHKARCIAISAMPSKWEEQDKDIAAENAQLTRGIEQLKSWIALDKVAETDLNELQRLLKMKGDPFFERRERYLTNLLNLQLRGLPAQVILRQPSNWNSQVWLNVGERENRKIGTEIVAPGSPVVIGKVVVGIVEEVLKNRCRVRLVTDKALHTSVRCVRGHLQNAHLSEACQELALHLNARQELEGATTLSRALNAFSTQVDISLGTDYLAKGILHGIGGSTIGKSCNLIGEGFQYDFADEEGQPRELRTGKGQGGCTPLIAVGDLLVTTGFDGIFPPDLRVGFVTKIHPLSEGSCSFSLEAKSLAPHFHQIKNVTVLQQFPGNKFSQ